MDNFLSDDWEEIGKSAWNVSLDAWAIVNEDFTFRAVNKQWIEIFGVLPSEFIGKSFGDVTAIEDRQKDFENAKLVIQGKIASYFMNKTYRFSDGSEHEIGLLVARVPFNQEKPFRFFLSRALPNNAKAEEKLERRLEDLEKLLLTSASSGPSTVTDIASFLWDKKGWVLMGATVLVALYQIIMEILKVS